MSSRHKKLRVIHVHFGGQVIEFEMEKNLNKWEGNNKMWNRFLKSVKSKFKLKTSFAIYDPNDDMFVDDMDDLCGCYIGYEVDYNFILSLHVKAEKEPLKSTVKTTKKPLFNIPSLLTKDIDENTSPNNDLIENMSELQLKPMAEIKAELGVSRRKSRRLSIDFGLFNNNETNCYINTVWLEFGAARIKKCDHLNRLISGLRYYSNLEIGSNDIDKDEFNNFFDDIYCNMLDDYLHVITQHSNDSKEIYDYLQNKCHLNINCNVRICPFIQRHFQQKHDDDPWINFYIQTYDSLHFWLFHLFDVGLRSVKLKKDISNNQKEHKNEEDDYVCYDTQFAQMISAIRTKKRDTNFLTRYNKINKYDLNLSLTANVIQHKSIDCERLTFKDCLMFHLQKTIKHKSQLQKFNMFINKEGYDSDAIMQDIDYGHGAFSNICNVVKNKQCLHQIKQYIKNTKLSFVSSAFNIGLIFYYWPYYKKEKEDLYVEMKHDTFKQEILAYGCINIWQYNNLIVLKAKQYQQTKVAKQITIKFNPHLHFDVDLGVLTRENFIALVLYTDFEQVSKEFVSTFKQIRLNESLQSIKTRNQKYWWLSKTIRETVQYFGDNGSPSGQYVKGPFYTHIPSIINISEFNISLCSPVSTSKQIEVITRFSLNINNKNGLIMQLNNNGDYQSARYLRSFNIGWISKYKEEEEILFIGGDHKIRIETIKIIQTKQNFSKYFAALFVFDCMCNGYDMDDHSEPDTEERPLSPQRKGRAASTKPASSTSKKKFFSSLTKQKSFKSSDNVAENRENGENKEQEKSFNYEIIWALIENKLENKCIPKNSIPLYIINSFNAFCRNKKVITLNLFYLFKNFKQYIDLIMNEIEIDKYNPYSNKNTFKSGLFSLFDNINKLVIYSTKYDGFPSYSFSLMSLLSSVEFTSTFKQIIIRATWHNGKHSWIHTMFDDSALTTVKALLQEHKCKIFLTQEKNNSGHMEDCLVIDRE